MPVTSASTLVLDSNLDSSLDSNNTENIKDRTSAIIDNDRDEDVYKLEGILIEEQDGEDRVIQDIELT